VKAQPLNPGGRPLRAALTKGPLLLPLVVKQVWNAPASGDTTPPGLVMYLAAR
jgi:hypothetical protein